MSDHKANHAAPADACQLNGVQSDIELRKWAIQTILLSPHPLPSSMELLEKASLRLTAQRVPRHRADVILSGYPDACGEIVRCGDALSVPQWLLTDTEVKVSKRGMRQVISGASTEFAARRVELLRPGAYRCALARGYRPGDKGRKIGGAPHAE